MRVSIKTSKRNVIHFLPHQVIIIFDTDNRSIRIESQFSILVDEKEIDEDLYNKIGRLLIKERDNSSIKEGKIDFINKNVYIIKKEY